MVLLKNEIDLASHLPVLCTLHKCLSVTFSLETDGFK